MPDTQNTTLSTSLDDAEAGALFADIFERSLLVARAQSVMPSLVRVFTDQQGKMDRHASQRGQIVAAAVAENAAIPLTEGEKELLASLTPGEFGAATAITLRAMRTDPDLVSDTAMELGQAMGEHMDVALLSAIKDFERDDIGHADDVMSVEHIEVAAAVLRDAKVPGNLVCVMSERQWYGIRADQRIDKAITNAPDFIRDELSRKRYMGSLGEVGIVVTPNVPVDTATDEVTSTAGLFATGSALAMDMRQSPAHDAHWRGGRRRLWEYSIVADGAFGVWRPDYGVPITTSAPVPAIDRSASYDA